MLLFLTMSETYEEAVKSVDSNSSITIYRTFNDEYSDDYAEGKIMSQTPAAGSKITQEDSVVVSVCVSKGITDENSAEG